MKPTYEVYPKYEKCIKKIVWKWVKRSRFDFDVLLSEANMAFLKAVDTYDETKACFHTHLYITVNGNLNNHCNQKINCIDDKMTTSYDARNREGFNSIEFKDFVHSDIIKYDKNPETEYTFKETIDNLSKEAREVVNVALNTPSEMVELVRKMSSNRQGHMHVYKTNIRSYFMNKGWKNALILSCFKEIKSTFS